MRRRWRYRRDMVIRGQRETSGLEGVSERLFTIQEQTASVDYLGESTEGDLLLVDAPRTGGVIDVLGLQSVGDVVDADVEKLAEKTDVFFLTLLCIAISLRCRNA